MFDRTRNAVLATLLVALVVGYAVAGHLLYKLAIGLDPSAFFAGEGIQRIALAFFPGLTRTVAGLVLLCLTLLAVAVFGFVAIRVHVRRRSERADPGRRTFLRGAVLGSVGGLGAALAAGAAGAARALLGVGHDGRGWRPVAEGVFADVPKTHPEWKDDWHDSRIRDYRRFGRTGWNVSDIVLGTGQITNGEAGQKIARQAIERGVNYFDTSPDYSGAGSEQLMGQAIRGVRDRLFIATKFCTPTGHLPAGTPVARYMEAVEGSLSRLRTDYVDLCHIHSCDSVGRLMDENVHEAFDRLKEQGKVRFLGFSSHTPNLVEVANTAIDSGRFDVMMLAYHHGIWPQLDRVIQRGREEQDMGIVAMKTLKGAKHHGLEGFRREADAYSQAALKWVLSNRRVSCAVISFFELQHVDEYLAASGKAVTAEDVALLRKYDGLIAGTYCAPHCGACLDSCPERVPIADVLRHRMYFEDYGREKEAMRRYAGLDIDAAACASCSAPCAGSCPLGIQIRERTMGAHELLTLG